MSSVAWVGGPCCLLLQRLSVLWGGLRAEWGVKTESEILCLGVKVKKNKTTCNSSLESRTEVPNQDM